MENEAKEEESKLITSHMRRSIVDEYQQIVSRTKNELSGKSSKLYWGEVTDIMNISGISNISNNRSSLSTTVLNRTNVHTDVYKSDIYRLVTQSISRERVKRPR
jgi:hypothetical protein